MEAENDNNAPVEICSVCGKLFKDGEGRFRMSDAIYCVDCYKVSGASCIGYDTAACTKEYPR